MIKLDGRIKHTIGKLLKKWRNTYPHIKICGYICILMVIASYLSGRMDKCNPLAGSILSNIASGLATGLIIMLVSSKKNQTLTELQIEKDYFTRIVGQWHTELNQFIDFTQKGLSLSNDAYKKEVDKVIFEMSCFDEFILANDSDQILVDLFGEVPSNTLGYHDDFNSEKQKNRYEPLIKFLETTASFPNETRNEIHEQLLRLRRKHLDAYGCAIGRLQRIDEKMKGINRALF